MSTTEPTTEPTIEQAPPRRGRRLLWNTAGVAVALAALVAALVLLTSSTQFERMVRARLAAQLQNAFGGRVEIGSFTWHLLDLEAEAGNIVIHGDEAPAEAPYARVEKLRARISVLGILSPHIRLRDLLIERPQIHLILYPDGSTNQPHPLKPRKSTSGLATLFRLQAGHMALEQGGIDIDDRAAYELDFQDRYQPLDFQGNDVAVLMQYVAPTAHAPESYHIDAGVRDLNLARAGTARATPPVHGYLQAALDLTRDAAYLRSMRITAHARGTKDRTLEISGALFNFAKPHWQAKVTGDLDMRLMDPVLGFPRTPEGIAHLDLDAAGQDGQFHVDGNIHAQQASYIGNGVAARGLDLSAHLHADPLNLIITSVIAHLQQGGQISGDVLLKHWLSSVSGIPVVQPPTAKPAPPNANLRKKQGGQAHGERSPAPVAPPHSTLVKEPEVDLPMDGTVNAVFSNVKIDTILEIVCPPSFQRLGIDAIVNGPAVATWNHGDTDTLSLGATFSLSPSGRPLPGEVPAHGAIDATYNQHDGSVDLRNLNLQMPASQLQARGHLGAYPSTSPTALTVDFHSRNLGDFDTVLRNLGVRRKEKSGAAALPVSLSGQADFQGTWAGTLVSPRLTGSLHATQLIFELPAKFHTSDGSPQTLHLDSVQADGSYDAEHIAIVHGTVQRGATQLLLDGTLVAPVVAPAMGKLAKHGSVRPDELPAFDDNSVVQARVRAEHLAASDVLLLAGRNLPVSGTLDAQLELYGPLHSVGGSGWLQLSDGTVYEEPITRLRAEGSLANQMLKLSSVQIKAKAGVINGSGDYDMHSGRFHAHAQANNIDVTAIQHARSLGEHFSGKLSFNLNASGTPSDPQIEGHAALANLTVSGEPLGTVDVTAHSTDHAVHYDVTSHMDGADLALQGQTQLHGDYPTEAKLEFSRLNIGSLFRIAHSEGIHATSALAGTATISGPLAHPDALRGDARIGKIAVVIAGVHLESDAALHATLDRGRITLDPAHITGDETDMRAQGSVTLTGSRRLDLAANGSVNLKLAQTIDPDVTAGGTSTFQIEAHGPLSDPGLRGQIEFRDGSLSLGDLPNGLSQINGRLEFNQNRLEVRSLTAITGGGQLTFGGYLAYQHGLFADLSVSGKNVRIRYPQGLSSLADANLQLQGTQSSLLLSGNVLLTRFSASPDLDIAALASTSHTVGQVVPPNAPSNHVRLDVRIQSSPQLSFQNAFARLAGNVDLRLRGTLASPSLLGRIAVTEGNANIAGTRYELQRGEVSFTNPVRIQPNIDLNASARVENYDITLGLHGTPEKMAVTYRSDPPLPEADVVALLALGRTQSEQGIYTQQQQQSAGVSPSTDVLLGGALNATMSSRVHRLFGAGAVKVDPSYLGALGNSTTRITVGEQLGKNVTLTYATNVNTTAQQLLQAEIAINRHVSLVVTRDESGVFSMVLRATRRYR